MEAFVAPPHDIRGKIIFLRGSFALCPGVFLTLVVVSFTSSSENQLLQLLYLECILSMLSSCPPTMHLSRGFGDLVWWDATLFCNPYFLQLMLIPHLTFSLRNIPSPRKQLCPSLVAIMGNPANDKTIASHHGYTGASDRLSDRHGLGKPGRHDYGIYTKNIRKEKFNFKSNWQKYETVSTLFSELFPSQKILKTSQLHFRSLTSSWSWLLWNKPIYLMRY